LLGARDDERTPAPRATFAGWRRRGDCPTPASASPPPLTPRAVRAMFGKRGQQRWRVLVSASTSRVARCYQQWLPIDIASLDDGALLPVVVEIDPALVCGGEQEPVFVPMVDLGSGQASLWISHRASTLSGFQRRLVRHRHVRTCKDGCGVFLKPPSALARSRQAGR